MKEIGCEQSGIWGYWVWHHNDAETTLYDQGAKPASQPTGTGSFFCFSFVFYEPIGGERTLASSTRFDKLSLEHQQHPGG